MRYMRDYMIRIHWIVKIYVQLHEINNSKKKKFNKYKYKEDKNINLFIYRIKY